MPMTGKASPRNADRQRLACESPAVPRTCRIFDRAFVRPYAVSNAENSRLWSPGLRQVGAEIEVGKPPPQRPALPGRQCRRDHGRVNTAGRSLVRDVILRDGTPLRLRTPTPRDYDGIKAFYDGLSEDSLYTRFHGSVRTEGPARSDAEADGDARVVLIGWRADRVVASGSYDRLREPAVAEVAFTVADDF